MLQFSPKSDQSPNEVVMHGYSINCNRRTVGKSTTSQTQQCRCFLTSAPFLNECPSWVSQSQIGVCNYHLWTSDLQNKFFCVTLAIEKRCCPQIAFQQLASPIAREVGCFLALHHCYVLHHAMSRIRLGKRCYLDQGAATCLSSSSLPRQLRD